MKLKIHLKHVLKKIQRYFWYSPSLFSEGALLEEKVNYIAKETKYLKIIKSKEFENKMKNIVELNRELENRKSCTDKKIYQDFERIVKLDY
ncbi:MAG: hypothetical protein ACR5KW_00395 [Wolbachia sp.]